MELRQYQQEDVDRIVRMRSCGVFNEQRTGKTPTSLVAMDTLTSKQILVVCTASMTFTWAAEAERWLPHRHIYLYTGSKKKRAEVLNSFSKEPSSILVVSYDLFKTTKSSDGLVNDMLKIKPEGLIVDEAHRLVGKTRKSKAFTSLRRMVKTPYRLYLTGTPAPNHPSQVWSLLTMLDPKKFSSFWRFAEEYWHLEEQRLPRHVAMRSGVSNIQVPSDFLPGKDKELQLILNEHSIMRKRAEVMKWLPEREEPERILLEPTASQIKAIRNLTKYFEHEHIIVQGILDQLIRMRQICNDPRLLDMRYRGPKTDWLVSFWSDYPDQKTIVFSRFTGYLKLLSKELGDGVELFVGDTTHKQRHALIDRFQNEDLNMLLIQIDAGKEGLTLDSADNLIFTDIYPPVSDIDQARDRIIATQAERVKPIRIIELAMKGTYDEALYQLVAERKELTDVVNDYINYITKEE